MSQKRRPLIDSSQEEKVNKKQKKMPQTKKDILGQNKMSSINKMYSNEANDKEQIDQTTNKQCDQIDIDSMELEEEKHDNYQKLTSTQCNSNTDKEKNTLSIKNTNSLIQQLSNTTSENMSQSEVIYQKKLILAESILSLIKQIKFFSQNLKDYIRNLISNYKQPQVKLNDLEELLIAYLQTNDEQSQQKLLTFLRENLIIKDNKFNMSSYSFQQIQLNAIFKQQLDLIDDVESNLIKLSQEDKEIDLSELVILNCPWKCVYNSFVGKRFNINNYIKHKEDKITLISGSDDETQYYLNVDLSFEKKYVLLFQFDILPETQFTLAVAKKSIIQLRVAYDEPNCQFSKTFLPRWVPSQDECSNIIKGEELALSPKLGQIIEVRISLNENKVEFTDYPERQNVNSNFMNHKLVNDNDPYVLTFNLCNQQQISILSFSEVSCFQN